MRFLPQCPAFVVPCIAFLAGTDSTPPLLPNHSTTDSIGKSFPRLHPLLLRVCTLLHVLMSVNNHILFWWDCVNKYTFLRQLLPAASPCNNWPCRSIANLKKNKKTNKKTNKQTKNKIKQKQNKTKQNKTKKQTNKQTKHESTDPGYH